MGKSGRKFDLGGLMEVVSNLDTTAVDGVAAVPEVKLIPLTDIVDNKANFYAVDRAGLKPLADSIAMDGLQQYPLVTPHRTGRGSTCCSAGTGGARLLKCWLTRGPGASLGVRPMTVPAVQAPPRSPARCGNTGARPWRSCN